MEVRLASLFDGASTAEGVVVVIDVFRAFTTAAVAFARGAEKIIMVATIEEALKLKDQGAGDYCMGEVDGSMPVGFDYGNSPYALREQNLQGKTLIQSTRAGTVGLCAVPRGFDRLYAGSLVVAKSTCDVIRAMDPEVCTVVAMGLEARTRTDEDEQCALFMRNLLEGRDPDPSAVTSLVRSSHEVLKFLDPEQPQFIYGDVDMCLDVNAYPFAICLEFDDKDRLIARPQFST